MTEWPEASRLKDVLEQANTEPSPPEDAWRDLQIHLADDGHVDLGPLPTSEARRPVALLGAAALLIVGLIAAGLIARRPNTVQTTDNDSHVIPSGQRSPSTTVPPLPTIRFDDCPGTIPRDTYRVGAGRGVQVAAVGGTGGLSGNTVKNLVVGIGAPGDILEGTGLSAYSRDVDLVLGTDAAIVTSPAYAALTDWILSSCTTGSFLLTLDGLSAEETDQMMCRRPPAGFGWHGVALVGIASAPAPCAGLPRTILIDERRATDPSVAGWAEAHGCGERQSVIDPEGNTITSWSGCSPELIHVETAGADPWQAEIDGVSTAEFVWRLRDMPN